MIRFIEIDDQVWCGLDEYPHKDWCLWDTVTNRFITIEGKTIYESVEDFVSDVMTYTPNLPLERLLGVIKDEYFTKHSRDYFIKKYNEPHNHSPKL